MDILDSFIFFGPLYHKPIGHLAFTFHPHAACMCRIGVLAASQDLHEEMMRPGSSPLKEEFLSKRSKLVMLLQSGKIVLPQNWNPEPLQLLDCCVCHVWRVRSAYQSIVSANS